jgi:RNA polymerase sigma-70 factor, ECF subfamily
LTDPGAIERFTALYDEHYRSVYAYAVSRAGRQLADEVAGEVFLVVWRRLDDVPRPALPWLLGVARNVVIGQFRAAARQQSIAAELRAWAAGPGAAVAGTVAGTVAGDVADQVSDRLTALRALASLTEADRELLTLVAWHGLSPRDAATVVGCSAATFFVRLHRARRRLERAMEDPASPPPGAARTRQADAVLVTSEGE